MDSTINTFKGYDKLDPADNRRPSSRRIRLALFLSIFLLLLLAAATIALALKESSERTSPPPPPSSSIRSVCSITLHPNSCLSALSSSNSTDPRHLFSLSLRVSIAALRAVADLPRQLSSRVNDSMVKEALGICTDQIQDAIDNLNTSLALVTPPVPGGRVALTKSKVDDIRTYLSAVLTDIETCFDGFEGTTGGFREKLEAALKNSTELTSNSLAIATHILSLLGTVHRKLLMMEHI